MAAATAVGLLLFNGASALYGGYSYHGSYWICVGVAITLPEDWTLL